MTEVSGVAPTVWISLDKRLSEAVGQNDCAAVRALVDQIPEVPGYIFNKAVSQNLLECIALLGPKCAEQTIFQGLNRAIVAGRYNTQTIGAILPYANQNTRNEALINACVLSRSEVVVDFLSPVCDIPWVLERLITCTGSHVPFWVATFQERINAKNVRERLNAEVSSNTKTSSRKM